MAGSLKWVIYTDDFGTLFALNVDESNWEAIHGTNNDYDGDPVLVDAVPRNVRPRFATYSNGDGSRNIRIPIASQTLYADLTTSNPTIIDPIAGTGNLQLVRLTPEKRRLPIPNDTGLADGDAT